MSTAPAKEKAQQTEHLLSELRARLEEVEFSTARLGPIERTGDGATMTVQLEAAAEAEDEAAPVTATFEEDLKCVLNKNCEFYRRLS